MDSFFARLGSIPFATALVPFCALQFNSLYRSFMSDYNAHAEQLCSETAYVEVCLCWSACVNG